MICDWAWLAGLYEGEGTLADIKANSVMLRVKMCDEDVVRRARAIAGAGSVNGPYEPPNPKAKEFWVWQVGRAAEVRAILTKILPYLGERRRARAVAALERLEGVKRAGYCGRGHPMSGENLYVSPRGQRHCRTCAVVWDKDRRRRDRHSNPG